ncbi:aromatic ring-hydroxylating dioxygenase subunit alpha [Mesorhizobium sp. M0119]|uniref:aromatic ring-hydroxylating oxygenase subunit alpha n=1 Tax=Mesorhizobium sp. M0119 TaxID=2956885 RepID=UPI003335E0CA
MQVTARGKSQLDGSSVVSLIDHHRPNWSLEQAFYVDPAIFELERELWFPRQWSLVAHNSEVPERGRYIVRQLFDEEIIVVRFGDGEGDIAAYYNVCTHRGSRLCAKDGRGRLLVCPYHAWSFRLTGELQTRQDLPGGVDPDAVGLHRVPTKCLGGLVFCGLEEASLPDFQPVADALDGELREHGIDRARIVARKSYPMRANWKLVFENFLECYHCGPAHPEYSSVNAHVKVSATRDKDKAAEWHQELETWRSLVGDAEFNKRVWEPGGLDKTPFGMHRKPIGDGRKTLSQNGQPVSRLMGGRNTYDGGQTGFRVGRLSFLSAANDFVAAYQFIPRNVAETDIVVTWLVDKDADANVDADAISWLIHVTTLQDLKIVGDNAAGVASRAYRPGPYTALESEPSSFTQAYLAEMRSLLTGERPTAAPVWQLPEGYAGQSGCKVTQTA